MDKNIDNSFWKPVKFKTDAFGITIPFDADKDFFKKVNNEEINCIGELIVDNVENDETN